jgi:molybdate transport system ATP-binding protein
MLHVTHDRLEALSLADEMIVLVGGRVLQAGPVKEVFSRPADLMVAGILTIQTIQPGTVLARKDDLVTVQVGTAKLSAVGPEIPREANAVHVCIRAEDVILVKGADAPSSARNHLPGIVKSVAREGLFMRVDLDCGFPLAALVTRQACEELVLQGAVVSFVATLRVKPVRTNRQNAGFTLIELLVATAIIAAVVSFGGAGTTRG